MKKTLSVLVILALVAAVFTSCSIGKKVEPENTSALQIDDNADTTEYTPVKPVDYVEVYSDKLDDIYGVIYDCSAGKESEALDDEEYTGIVEACRYGDCLDSIGYYIKDISGDGVAELIVGISEENEFNHGTRIISVYSYDGENINCVVDGWYRNSWYLLDSFKLFNQGANSAASTIYGTFKLKFDGSGTECENLYFTDALEDSEEEIGYFMNPNGEAEADAEGTCIVSEEEFNAFTDSCMKAELDLEITPFGKWGLSSISLSYLEDVNNLPAETIEYTVEKTDYSTKVVFSSQDELKNFSLLAVAVEDIDEEGNVSYSKETVKTFESLTCPLVAELAFYGDMPNNGFSVSDRLGNEVSFAILQSGEDGSLTACRIFD